MHCVQTTGEEEAVDFNKEQLENKFPRVCPCHTQPGKDGVG